MTIRELIVKLENDAKKHGSDKLQVYYGDGLCYFPARDDEAAWAKIRAENALCTSDSE